MKNNFKKLDDRILITGKVIQGTIQTMASLGEIGTQVLAEYGIKKIDEKKFYSYQLRSEIHKAVFDRFGGKALTAIGFNTGEIIIDHKNTKKTYEKQSAKFESNDEKMQHVALEAMFNSYVSEGDRVIKEANKQNPYNFGNSYEKLSNTSFRVTSYSTWLSHQYHFLVGILEYVFCVYFAKHWTYKLRQDKRHTKIKDGFCAFSINVEFKSRRSENSVDTLINHRRNQLKDDMLKEVLNDAENQKKDAQQQKEKLVVLSEQIGKYIPPQIHQALLSGKYDTRITTRRRKLTVFFSDIKNFTTISEDLQPEDLTKYLNEYFSEMTAIALACGATIDKYIGDAMMVFFGDPDSKGEHEDARSCVEMALQMQEKMKVLHKKWRNGGFLHPFEIRMGINTGYCNVGNFGSNQRLTYTIIGGQVNVAQRLEAAAEANGILISHETYAHTQDMLVVEDRPSIQMKGINRDIKIFAIKSRAPVTKNHSEKEKKPKEEDSLDVSPDKENTISLQTLQIEILDLNSKIQILENMVKELTKG